MRVEGRRLFFNERDFLPLEKVHLDHPDEKGMAVESFAADRFPWIKVWVQGFEDGVLDCDISDFKPPAGGFTNPSPDLSGVRNLLFFVDGEKVLEFARPKPRPKVPSRESMLPRSLPHKKNVVPQAPPRPETFEEQVCFKVPIDRVRFAEGCAVVNWSGRLMESQRFVRLEAEVKNSFISQKLNCIKSYVAECIGEVDFCIDVRVSGGEAEVLNASSDAIASISSQMISEVRYHYAKGELRRWNQRTGRIVTAEGFFGGIKEAGFGESDEEFIADILRVKAPKHATHIEYLAAHHRSDLIRLRIVKCPFAFLCFLSGRAGGFFVWETLDGTDATYVWKHERPMEYLTAHKPAFKRWLVWVERQIDLIHAAGRDEYWKSAP